MAHKKKSDVPIALIKEWTLPAAVTLGSAVRAKGILLEIRARLPATVKKSLDIKGAVLILGMAEEASDSFRQVAAVVEKTLDGIERLPVIPREIEDILTISTTERHRWLKDGRLQSAGTRTVKLHGRAKKITFHVFDPRLVEDVLDRDLISTWREDDVIQKAENRRLARETAALKRKPKAAKPLDTGTDDVAGQGLKGWEEFARDGLLR